MTDENESDPYVEIDDPLGELKFGQKAARPKPQIEVSEEKPEARQAEQNVNEQRKPEIEKPKKPLTELDKRKLNALSFLK